MRADDLTKHSVRTAQYTHTVSVIKTSQLMFYLFNVAASTEIYTKHINTLCGQNVELYKVPNPYRAVNTHRLGYKYQSVNAV
jgi:hypothetical protein